MQLLSVKPSTTAELEQGARDIFIQCGFAVNKLTEGRLQVLDQTTATECNMLFQCAGICEEAQMLEMQAEIIENIQLKGILCLEAAEALKSSDEVKVFTWEQFNQYFQNPWLQKRMVLLQEAVKPLVVFTDAFSDRYDDLYQALAEDKQAELMHKIKAYSDLPLKCNTMMGVPFWLHYNQESLEKAASYEDFIFGLEQEVHGAIGEFCMFYGLDEPRTT